MNTAKKRSLECFIFLLLVLSTEPSVAEGSKELSINGGYRAFLVSSTIPNLSYPFPTLGTMKVYARVGEAIYTGSSVQGFGFGTINLRAPNGAIYSSGSSTTIGLITNRSQELAGPLPNAGGYTPFVRIVLPGQEGIWEIDFISQNNGAIGGANPVPLLANANWTQPPGEYIAAFDISVRNINNSSFLQGRVFTNIFSGILGTFDVGFNGIFKILTKDGYQYNLDNNGQAGNGFSFFANNKGFRNTNGSGSYKSINSLISPNIQDPRFADSQADITHKIFFNVPAADLPPVANTSGGTSTWLLTTPIEPTLANVSFNGIEGSAGGSGTDPLSGIISFNTDKNGTYSITIDVNNNSLFNDAIDRKLTGPVTGGLNKVNWDGLDGMGNKVSANTTSLAASISISLFSGEVHFPFFDVERNINGIKLTRINGPNIPDNTLYWDDSLITGTGTPSNPASNLTGTNSLINGHKWGTVGAGPVEFGNEKGLDTWAYISGTVSANVSMTLQEADLEIISISQSQNCTGKDLIYTVSVRNNGPDNVTGTKFRFTFPEGFTTPRVSSISSTGTSGLLSETISANGYDAVLNIDNNAVRVFTVSGSVITAPPGGILNVTSSIMRTADFTDPDATNPDASLPADPVIECNSLPSGVGCNNIKSFASSFSVTLAAGPDQLISQNTTVTMAAMGVGTWVQSGSLPSLAIIANPSSASSIITGLKTIGTYTFIWANMSGCTDTMNITVTSSVDEGISIPNIFTPNGDGKNDVFEIKGLDAYPGSQLLVFNRWGNEVYRSENYINTWNGSDLAEGTYYYVLSRKESTGLTKSVKGWVYLKRGP